MTYFNEFGQGRVGFRAPSGLTPLLLDTYSGAAAAYSLRKLRNDYTGSAITVRRSSDNTSTNIGFDANGNLDTTALTSFVGSNNISLYSEEFDNANWSKYITTITSNQTTAPDGTITADLLAEASANNYHTLYNATILSFAVGTSWNVSVYVKKGPGTSAPNTIILGFPSPTTNTFPHPCVLFNISSGTVLDSSNVSNDANFGSSIVDAGNGWWRCSVWGTVTSAGNRYQHGVIRFNNNLNTINGAAYAGNAQSNIYIWGWQFQKALNDTSVLTTQPYTKTTATANAGNGFVSTWFDQSGNGRNATQATAASQPQIVNNGNLLLDINLKPTIKFDGANDLFDLNYQWANTTFFSFNVWNSFVVKNRAILSEGRFSSGYLSLGARDAGWSNKFYVAKSGLVGYPFTSTATINTVFLTNYYSTDANGSSYTVRFRKNNGSEETTTVSGLLTNSSSAIGVSNGGDYLNGNIQEIILYSNNQSSSLTGINTNINSYYSIY